MELPFVFVGASLLAMRAGQRAFLHVKNRRQVSSCLQGSSCLTLEYLYLTPIHVYLTPIHDPDSPGAFVQDLAHAGDVLEQIRIVDVHLQGQIDLVRQVGLVQGLCKAGQV